jgi:hypothetical protein
MRLLSVEGQPPKKILSQTCVDVFFICSMSDTIFAIVFLPKPPRTTWRTATDHRWSADHTLINYLLWQVKELCEYAIYFVDKIHHFLPPDPPHLLLHGSAGKTARKRSGGRISFPLSISFHNGSPCSYVH